MYDSDFEEKRKLKPGEIYEAEIRRPRNIKFMRKYFALIHLAWEYQTDVVRKGCFNDSIDSFRHTILLNTGFCERIYSYARQEYVDIPKSIAFAKMSEEEFGGVYESTLTFIVQHLLPKNISKEEFEENIEEFLK